MRQIAVISGKGGTGKTVLTGSFAACAKDCVIADCDVDASDMHLILSPNVKEEHVFQSGLSAEIDALKCTKCGKCREACRFNAISEDIKIDKFNCEGCGFCALVCPVNAVAMKDNFPGKWYVSETRFGPMVHAALLPGEENSGKLVSTVRKKAQNLAEETRKNLVLIDGSPGIGCPVIASISGVDLAVVVTEPTKSGLHDARRVVEVARHFKTPAKIIINKFDLNEEIAGRIIDYCESDNVEVLGRIKYDKSVIESIVKGKTITEHASGDIKKEIQRIWAKIS